MRKYWVIIVFVTLAVLQGFSQKVLSVDLGKIKSLTSEITSKNYYPGLLNRFVSFDTTLTPKEVHLLYYGKYFQSFYNPSSMYEEREEMFDLIKLHDYEAALVHGQLAFESDPIDLKTIFGLYLCNNQIGKTQSAEKFEFLYYALIGTIIETGSGNKVSEAFVIMNISDEYEIISTLGKHIKKQKLVKGNTDCFKLKKGEDKSLNSIKKIYFNISIPLMKAEE